MHISSSKRLTLYAIGAIAVVGLWYSFRPEKLFINKRVNETSPAEATGQLTALFTGRFQGSLHKTSGRVTVYRLPDGSRILRLNDFSTSNGPALHVLLVDGQDPNAMKDFDLTDIKSTDLGDLKGNQGDQDYRLSETVDLARLSTVSIYCMRFRANFGTAELHPF